MSIQLGSCVVELAHLAHLCREDAHAVLQLYLLHVRDDPAFMTYQELVDFELRNLPWKADAHDS